MSKIIQLSAAALIFMLGAAEAGVIQVGGMAAGTDGRISSRSGVCAVDFNSGNATNSCMVTYSRDAAGAIPLGASNFPSGTAATHAAPFGDTTNYLSIGTSDGTPIYVNLGMSASYFGFYAGSLDTFNLVEFFMGGILVDSFDGDQINAVAFPGHATTGNRAEAQYVDYFPGVFVAGQFVPALFDRVRIGSSGNSFETDNHAFGRAAPLAIPEPGPLALVGLSALWIFSFLRRKDFHRG